MTLGAAPKKKKTLFMLLFAKLTSKKLLLLKMPLPIWVNRVGNWEYNFFVNPLDEGLIERVKDAVMNAIGNSIAIMLNDNRCLIYTLAPWQPLKIAGKKKRNMLPAYIYQKIGLTDAFLKTTYPGRIMSFKLYDAIQLSYSTDIRFVIFLTAFFGFVCWFYLAPDPVLNIPITWYLPNLGEFSEYIRHTYNNVCAVHPSVMSPCDCGEGLNKVVREYFPPDNTSFDPLQTKPTSGQIKTISIMAGSIIILLLLNESVSTHGVYIPL